MPTRPTKGLVGKFIELDPAVIAEIEDLADRNDRSFRDEVEHALRRHAAQPPTITVTVPPLLPAKTEDQPKGRGRGRPAGSKNQPKAEAPAPEPQPPAEPGKPTRRRKKEGGS